MDAQSLAAFRQYLVTIIGCFSLAITGSAAGWPSPVLMKIKNSEAPISLSQDQISWMVSMMFLGHLMSPIPSGILMDKLGRKRSCQILAFLPLTSWMLISCTSSVKYLYIARFTVGLWAGAASTIMPIYIGEIAESRLRGSLTVFNHLMRNFGVLVVYTVGPLMSYRALALSCTSMTLIFIVAFTYVPESPYFFVMKDKHREAYETLKWLRGGKENFNLEEELERIENATRKQMLVKGSFRDILCDKGNRKALIISEFFAVSKRFIGSGVLQAYVSITLPPITFGIFSPNDCVIVLGLISFLSSFAAVFCSSYLSRRLLLSISCTGCGITMTLVSVWFYLNSNSSLDMKVYGDWLFICFIVYNGMFSLGLGPAGMSVKGELFTANVKALCSSLTTVLVALSSFFLNKFFLIISENFGMYLNFLIYAISSFVTIAFTWMYLPETKGKTLEEIQSLLKGTDSSEKQQTNTVINKREKLA